MLYHIQNENHFDCEIRLFSMEEEEIRLKKTKTVKEIKSDKSYFENDLFLDYKKIKLD